MLYCLRHLWFCPERSETTKPSEKAAKTVDSQQDFWLITAVLGSLSACLGSQQLSVRCKSYLKRILECNGLVVLRHCPAVKWEKCIYCAEAAGQHPKCSPLQQAHWVRIILFWIVQGSLLGNTLHSNAWGEHALECKAVNEIYNYCVL